MKNSGKPGNLKQITQSASGAILNETSQFEQHHLA
jgi:hypothetical protein